MCELFFECIASTSTENWITLKQFRLLIHHSLEIYLLFCEPLFSAVKIGKTQWPPKQTHCKENTQGICASCPEGCVISKAVRSTILLLVKPFEMESSIKFVNSLEGKMLVYCFKLGAGAPFQSTLGERRALGWRGARFSAQLKGSGILMMKSTTMCNHMHIYTEFSGTNSGVYV